MLTHSLVAAQISTLVLFASLDRMTTEETNPMLARFALVLVVKLWHFHSYVSMPVCIALTHAALCSKFLFATLKLVYVNICPAIYISAMRSR